MEIISIICVCAICTFVERLFPFVVFRNRGVSDTIRYLGKVLPMAVMGTLVVYCLRSTTFESISAFAPQLIAVTMTALLHLWKRNTLVSVLSGTICYMVCVQMLF